MQNWNDHFDLLIKSKTPLIFVRSGEEERVESLLVEATKKTQFETPSNLGLYRRFKRST